MTDVYVPGAVSRIVGGSENKTADHLTALFSPTQTEDTERKTIRREKRITQSDLVDDEVQHNTKKRKRKKPELIDDLEKQYEEKKTKIVKEPDNKTQSKPSKEIKNVKEYPRPRRNRKKRDVDQEGRTVFVGNLSTDVTKKTLKKLFKKYGEIESIRFRSAAPADLKLPKKAIVITKAFHEERHNINCYVVFKEQDAAKEALQENGTEIKGFHVRVDLSTKTKQHKHGNSIFVGNIPFDAEEEPLRKHFEDCGEIENIRLIRDRTTQLGKGFGYVLFKDKASVELALRLNGESWSGRKLRVSRSSKQPSGEKREKKRVNKTGKSPTTSGAQSTFQGTKAQKLQKIKKKKKFKKKTQTGNKTELKSKKKKQTKKIPSSKIGAMNRISKKMKKTKDIKKKHKQF